MADGPELGGSFNSKVEMREKRKKVVEGLKKMEERRRRGKGGEL